MRGPSNPKLEQKFRKLGFHPLVRFDFAGPTLILTYLLGSKDWVRKLGKGFPRGVPLDEGQDDCLSHIEYQSQLRLKKVELIIK